MSSQAPALGRVMRTFAIVQVVAILIPAILMFFDIDLGNSTNLVGSFGAAMFAAHLFVKIHGRAPTREERRRLVWLSFAVSWAISLMFVGVMVALAGAAAADVFKEVIQKLPAVVLAIVVLVVSAMYLGVYYVAYGPLARKYEQNLAIKRS